MTSTPDLVIRGGNIADGKGGDLYEADIAISGGRITEVGKVAGTGKEEIDARGKLVTPGFVDVHTHYDGQVTWSHDITPSSENGVTTAIMGNCGVGFAPCRPSDHVRLIQLMEGVEDIPEPVLSAGIPWAWESFPDYMEWLHELKFANLAVANTPRALDPRGQQSDGGTGRRRGSRRRARLLDLAHPQPPHLDRRLHADAKGRRGRTDRDCSRDACRGTQRPAVRARSLHHQRRPADDAAGRREHQDPGDVLDHAERQGAAALAQNARHHPRRFGARPQYHRANPSPPGRADARSGIVAQPVPDPSELQGDRPSAADGAAEASAPARDAQGDPERARHRDRRSAVLPAELRQDVSARQSAGLRTAAGKYAGRAGPPPGPAAGRTRL